MRPIPHWATNSIVEMAHHDTVLHACLANMVDASTAIETLAVVNATLLRELIEARTKQRTVTLLCTEEERRRWCVEIQDDEP